MMGSQLAGVRQARSLQQFGQRMQRVQVKMRYALRFVGYHQGTLAQCILGGDAGGAFACVASLGLDAADGEHEAARRVRSEEHTSEIQSLMRISYAVFCLKKKKQNK